MTLLVLLVLACLFLIVAPFWDVAREKRTKCACHFRRNYFKYAPRPHI